MLALLQIIGAVLEWVKPESSATNIRVEGDNNNVVVAIINTGMK